jgi:hypothetical protein
MKQRRLVFKLIQQNKDSNQTVKVDLLWRKFMELPEKEAFERGKPLLESKEQLIHALNKLEEENCIMYSVEDGNVVLI